MRTVILDLMHGRGAKAEPVTARPDGDGRPLREFVRASILDRITDGTYPPGTRLVERDLAGEFGVSRLPIREALRMLDTEGFVEMLPTRGVIVRQLSRTDVMELFDVREALETLAFRRAAERMTKADVRKLEALARKAERAVESNDAETLYGCNVTFHDVVPVIARNKVLASTLEPIEGRLHYINLANNEPEVLWAEHRIMLQALISGDAELSQQLSYEHIAVNRARVLVHLFGTQGTRSAGTTG